MRVVSRSCARFVIPLAVAATVAAVVVLAGCGGAAAGAKTAKPADTLDTQGRIRMAGSLYQNGRPAEALETLEEAIRKDPDNAAARSFYGQLLLLSNRLTEAEQALQEALEADPHFTDAHNNLGAVYDRMDRADDAEREYRRALEDRTYPTPEKVHLNLGLLYDRQGRQDEAERELRRAVGINPKFYQGHFELATLLERNGELEEAVRLYEVAAPGYRATADYHYRIGATYMKLGDKIKAREHLARVQEISPGSETSEKAIELLGMIR